MTTIPITDQWGQPEFRPGIVVPDGEWDALREQAILCATYKPIQDAIYTITIHDYLHLANLFSTCRSYTRRGFIDRLRTEAGLEWENGLFRDILDVSHALRGLDTSTDTKIQKRQHEAALRELANLYHMIAHVVEQIEP